jgi:exonuclease SbcC
LNGEIEALTTRLQDEKRIVTGLTEKIEETRKAVDKIGQTIKARQKEILNRQELEEIKHWFALEDHLLQNLEALKQEGVELRRANEALEDQKFALLNVPELSEWITPIERVLPVESLLAVLEKTARDLEKEIQELEEKIAHHRMQAGLEAAAADLTDGQPCPVCGSVHHPNKLESTNFSGKIQKNERRRSVLRDKMSIVSEAQRKLSGLRAIAESREEAWQNFVNRRDNETQKLAKHRKNFRWKTFSAKDREAFAKALQSISSTEAEIVEIEQQRENLEQRLEELRRERENHQQVLAGMEQEHTAKVSIRKTLQEQLRLLDLETFAGREMASMEIEAGEIAEAYNRIETEYRETEEKITALRKELDTLNGQVSALEKNLKKFFQQREALETAVEKKIAESKFENLVAVETILALELDIAAEKVDIEEFFRKQHSASEQLKQLLDEAKDQEYDEAVYQELVGGIEELKTAIKHMNQEVGGVENEIGKLKKDLKIKSELQHQLAELQQRAENISTLMKLFRGSGFVNYISGVFLKNLCYAANERFQKLTRRHLRLEVTENNDFQVRDFLHDGQVRSIKTLSGGQTFQAALSLALALADNIQKLSHSGQNFFFLDEGFGSLDRESLRVVFDTLKSLRKENRIVGVISHVEDLRQDIDVHLKIRNDEEKGSLISAFFVHCHIEIIRVAHRKDDIKKDC